MDTIAALCDHVVVLAGGRNLAEGTFAELASNPAVQEAYMGRPPSTSGSREGR
jgi:ABC-type branched-subunit amino acid transport system ATPase component